MNLSMTGKAVKLLSRVFDHKSSTEPIIKYISDKEEGALGPVSSPLPTAAPEEMGVPSGYIEKFLREAAESEDVNMHSIIIIRNGKIITKAEKGAQLLNVSKYTFSACKSIVSLAIGCLIDEGLLTYDEKIADIFDKECPALSKVRSRQLIVEHLLTMTSGLTFGEAESQTTENWIGGFLSGSMRGDPGEEFYYNSINTYLLAAIVVRKTGMSLCEYLDKKIFAHMDIKDYYWEKSPEGIEKGGWGLYMKPEDMAKLGILVMNYGKWGENRLISEEYIKAATTAKIETPEEFGNYDYGYQIWTGVRNSSFLFNGMLGQNLLGFRKTGIIIVSNAGDNENFQRGKFFELAERYFSGTFLDSLAENKAAEDSLNAYIDSISLYKKESIKLTEEERACLLGRKFVSDDIKSAAVGLLPMSMQIIHGNYATGIKRIVISDRTDMLEIIYEEEDETNRMIVGIGKPEICVLRFKNQSYLAAVCGKFTHDEDDNPVLKIQVDFIETPFSRLVKLVIKGDGALLKQEEWPGKKYMQTLLSAVVEQQGGKTLLSAALDSIDLDYIEYKADRIMSPVIKLKDE